MASADSSCNIIKIQQQNMNYPHNQQDDWKSPPYIMQYTSPISTNFVGYDIYKIPRTVHCLQPFTATYASIPFRISPLCLSDASNSCPTYIYFKYQFRVIRNLTPGSFRRQKLGGTRLSYCEREIYGGFVSRPRYSLLVTSKWEEYKSIVL